MRMQPSPHDAPRSTSRATAPDAAGIVVPLRSFRSGKARLAEVLDDDARSALAQRMAETVVAAAGGRDLVIVSSAPEVVRWCATQSLERIDDPGSLDAAAAHGRDWARARGLVRVVVVHGDLPLATSLDGVAGDGAARTAVVVPDHRDDGTPVCSIPVDVPFAFAYGPGSFARHIAAARHVGLSVRVLRDRTLAFDVDVPEDLEILDTEPAS